MFKKVLFLIVCLSIGLANAQTKLMIDFSITGGAVQSGYEAYEATHEVADTFDTKTYSAFGKTISITPSWAEGAVPAVMQLIDRGEDDGFSTAEDDMLNLFRDWIGSDTRSVGDPMTLTISGLPAGVYSWKSYHHDSEATNMSQFDVTVNDAEGSNTTNDVQITGSADTTELDGICTFETTITSNGGDVTLVFDMHDYVSEYNEAWFLMNGFEMEILSGVNLGAARKPEPSDRKKDVIQEVTLSWIPGDYADTHNIFLGTDFNDVNDATVSDPLGTITSIGQAADANTFEPGLLQFGTTYYWRVDEVNAPANQGEYKGEIWRFTLEPVALNFPYANIEKVTAISSSGSSDPNDTVNGEGLDPDFPDQHSGSTGSWASSGKDDVNDGIWIQYDFDQQYKIHEMLVWNFNHKLNYRYGFKDVLVQYSADGQAWVDINDVNQFAQADGKSTYVYNTIVDFNDAVVKSVRITAFSNYGSKSFGLSEVRFTYIPVRARVPSPADGTENVAMDAILKWRKGREADSFKVYIDTNETVVSSNEVAPVSLSVSSYMPTLALGNTYYWRVDSISDDDTPSLWEGNIWSFSTPSTIIVDNFEVGYGDTGTDAVYLTWKDAEELGNKTVNGSVMGRAKKPYLQTINHSGSYSAPMKYDTLKHNYSEVIAQTIDLPIGTSDWSYGLPKTLTIWFRGDPNATEVGDSQLYCKLGGKKAVYGGSIDVLERDMWRQWDIDLVALGANLANVSEITIGIEKIGSVGGSGVIYLDDIALTGFEPVASYPDLIIEAEAFDSINGPIEVNDVLEGASGGEYIHVKNGTAASQTDPPSEGIVTYELNLTGGQYVIWGRVNIEAANQDAFWVKIDGASTNVDLHTSDWCRWNQIPAGAEWHWDDVHMSGDSSTDTVIWTLPAGVSTLSIAYRDTDATNPPRLDALLIQKVGE